MKKILVTGAAGFIGSHLIEECLNRGWEVRGVDDLSVGRIENFKSFANHPRFSFLKADVNDGVAVQPLLKDIDWVFHLAARADIVPSIEMPIPYHRANVDGTVQMLELAREARVKRFLYAASSSCYGIPNQFPTQETAAIQPQYPYALTKWLGEQCVLHWGQVYKLPVVSLRLFNVYGPRARTSGTYGAVFGVFLAQKLHGRPLTIVGDGTQTRDFTYVTDVVDAFLTAAVSDLSGVVMNVGSGGTYSVNRLVELLGGEKNYIPKRPGEPDCTFADTSKIRKLLNWKAKVSFEEGVERLLATIEDWRKAPLWTKESIATATENWFKYLGN